MSFDMGHIMTNQKFAIMQITKSGGFDIEFFSDAKALAWEAMATAQMTSKELYALADKLAELEKEHNV